jgi:hypothetical protein
VKEQTAAQTKAAETYAALTGLSGQGLRLAEAIRTLAADTGRSEAAIRASYYAQRVKLGHHGRRNDTISVDEAIDEARRLLEQALEQLDNELAAAKTDLDAATVRYEHVREDVEDQRARLEHTLNTLTQPSGN